MAARRSRLYAASAMAFVATTCLVAFDGYAEPAIAPAFAGSYSVTNLGSVPTPVPFRCWYGGLTFIDSDTIVIGGCTSLLKSFTRVHD